MTRKVCCALLAVLALPFILDATIGCSFAPAPSKDPSSYMCACNCTPEKRHRDLRIDQFDEDAEQRLDNTILLNSNNLDFLNGRYIGLLFRNAGIPQGATILQANVQFTSDTGSVAGPITVQIAAEIPSGQSFGTNPGSLGALPTTAASVTWNVPDWTVVGETGPNELTPDLTPVLQELVNRGDWFQFNGIAVIIKGTAGAGRREAVAFDEQPAAAALLSVDYTEPNPTLVGPLNLPVCLPPALNENIAGGMAPTDMDLTNDCTGRVQTTLNGLAQACNYPSQCTCSVVAGSEEYSGTCNADTGSGPGVCSANPVDMSCTNFDPKNGNVTATNADGDQPVCLANSPLSAEVFGRFTTCTVSGTAKVKVGDDSENSNATGTVQFVGDPCPGQSCSVGMLYRLGFSNVQVGNFFESATFNTLAGLGENLAADRAVLSAGGDGTFGAHTLGGSGQGRRDTDHLMGLDSMNDDPVNIHVGWGEATPMCEVAGTVAGNVDPELKQCNGGPDNGNTCQSDNDCTQDPSCGSSNVCPCVAVGTQALAITLDVTGNIINQPPTANAGPDLNVECATKARTDVVLDATRSSDPDGNIALYSWFLGSRTGKEVGFEPLSKVEQALGSETYVLRVIDAFGQADEDMLKVDVVDTTPPVVTCSVAMPMLLIQKSFNLNLINVGLMGTAVDTCEGPLPVGVHVFSNEDDQENSGNGRFSPDAKDIAVGTLRLRAERDNLNFSGRVYLIVTDATDSTGNNRGFNCCTVAVPHSSAISSQMVAQNSAAAAQAFCLANNGTPPPNYFVVGDGPVIGPKQ